MGLHLTQITEGITTLLVPDLAYYGKESKFPPSNAPVFYNPRMEFSRDLSVCALNAYATNLNSPIKIADPLSATGVRGFRYAKEVNVVGDVWINDINPAAKELMRKNIHELGLNNIHVCSEDANLFLLKNRYFDVIDIDPFGPPTPFMDSAIQSIRKNNGLLTATATDTSALCGAYPKRCMEKYGSLPLHDYLMKEFGARILIYSALRIASAHELTLLPLLTQSSDHYFKIFVKTSSKPFLIKKQLSKIGVLSFCSKCGYFELHSGLSVDNLQCKICGRQLSIHGPLWLGELHDLKFVEKTAYFVNLLPLGTKQRLKSLINRIAAEASLPPFYYDTHALAKKHKLPVKGFKEIFKELDDRGYSYSTTHFLETAVKTNAPFDVFLEVLKK